MSNTKDDILRVAKQLYLEGGLSGMSLRKVATEVGVSATAIYRHFDDKQAIVFALVADGYRAFSAAITPPTAKGAPQERLLQMADAYAAFVLSSPATYALLFLSTHHLGDGANAFALPPHLQAAGRDALWLLVREVEAAVEAGVVRRDDVLTSSRMLWGQLHGLAALHLAQRLGVSDDAYQTLSHNAFAATLRGLHP